MIFQYGFEPVLIQLISVSKPYWNKPIIFRCDQTGHFARECPSGGDRGDSRRGGGGGGGGSSSSVCYRCDGVGRSFSRTGPDIRGNYRITVRILKIAGYLAQPQCEAQGPKGIRQWLINWCTVPMIMNKITPSVDSNKWLLSQRIE